MISCDFTKATELAISQANHRFPRLSAIRARANPAHCLTIAVPDVTEPAFFLLDMTMASGQIRLIEANVSNGAMSSTIAEGDVPRARHMAEVFLMRVRPAGQVVVVLCHQAGFLHLPEFFMRAELFRAELSLSCSAALRGPDEELGDEVVAIICGSTAVIAARLERRGVNLFYRNRPVVFGTNPNLLPELARQGVIATCGSGYDIDETFFHEGISTLLGHDKSAQQVIAGMHTGIQPLEWQLAHDRQSWLQAVEFFQRRGLHCVAKMHAGSGGAGIEIVEAGFTFEQSLIVLDRILASARSVYGTNAERTAFPIQMFEFAQSDPVMVAGAPHLWDLRIMALAYPGRVECHACVARLCPEPFDNSWRRETWVSNLTGRDGNAVMEFMRAPGDLGLTDAQLQHLLRAAAVWTATAAQWRPGDLAAH